MANSLEELSEVVRLYAKAVIVKYKIPPYTYKKAAKTKDGTRNQLEFGVSDGQAIQKQASADKRKAKSKKRKQQDDKPHRRSINFGGRVYSDEELAQLAEQARLALAEACELAGGRVFYCCGYIHKEGLYECASQCKSKQHYKRVDELIEQR